MLRPAALALLLLLPACKDRPKTAAAPAADDAGPAAAAEARPRRPRGPLLPPAPPPEPVTAEDCAQTGGSAVGTLRAVAEARGVPADQLADTAAQIAAAFVEACQRDGWPPGLLDCVGKAPAQATTYQRCFDRMPAAARATWEARLDGLVVAAGGSAAARPPEPAGEGIVFEALCPAFVAEMHRLDDCAGAGMYVPALEEVWFQARRSAVGGVIPADLQPALRALCDERTETARQVASNMCRHLHAP
jgi:hypothetical protein